MGSTQGRDPRGRITKGDGSLSRQVFARLTPVQHVAYLAAGGAEWLRSQLDAEIARQRLAPTPTANNPFPMMRDDNPTFDQAQVARSPIAQGMARRLRSPR